MCFVRGYTFFSLLLVRVNGIIIIIMMITITIIIIVELIVVVVIVVIVVDTVGTADSFSTQMY